MNPDEAAVGEIVLAATPLGNPRRRLARLWPRWATADVVAAEDTRRLVGSLADLGVTPAGRIVSFYDATSASAPRCSSSGARGERIVLVVTDAGMPTVSDPGLPAGRAGGRGAASGHGPARTVRGAHRAGPVRAAGRPVLLRGLPAAQGGRAGRRRLRRAGSGAAHDGLLRGAAPAAAMLAALAEALGRTAGPRSAGS